MRQGPKPLAMHIGLSSAGLKDCADAAEKLSAMIRGIQLYHNAPYQREASDYDVIWRQGQTSLRLIRPIGGLSSEKMQAVCLLVPSLINGSEILDLSPERSLAQYMTSRGFICLVLDWGDLRQDEPDLTLDGLVSVRLRNAYDYIERQYQDKPLHMMGYCMGGALALGLAALAPSRLSSLTLLATPWNFHAGQKDMLGRVRFWSPSALASIESRGYLGADYLQSLFASIDPDLTRSKFSRFLQMDQDSENARIFIAVEDWLNDGKDLPGGIARECIVDWFLENSPCVGAWTLDGNSLDLSMIQHPVLVVASRKDRLVEFESAVDLKRQIPHAQILEPDCGHIGMIAGQKSIAQVWNPVANWMKSQN